MMHTGHARALLLCLPLILGSCSPSPGTVLAERASITPIGHGWARSSVNAVVFRQSPLVTHGDWQFAAYYDPDGRMVLARRTSGEDRWDTHVTRYRGNVRDAHNAISLGVDGDGYLHVSWDHHGQPLNYARSIEPGGLELTDPRPQTGQMESRVTYPGFYHLPDGDLLFLYRDGGSGDGDVLLNRYRLQEQRWEAVQHPLIEGEGERNAYVNRLVVDADGVWHVSWTWRETPDVASNHDVLYARSRDGGRSWERSTGERYSLPILAADSEVAWPVPQGSELINQTSMAVDSWGRPAIATYWRAEGEEVPQFRLVWLDADGWRMTTIGERTLAFRLSGGGTKRIPISRPQVVAGEGGVLHVVFRDEERGGGVTVATSHSPERDDWVLRDTWTSSVGLWEPSFDPTLWDRDGRLHLLHQYVGQGDGETLEDVEPQMVGVLEVEVGGRR